MHTHILKQKGKMLTTGKSEPRVYEGSLYCYDFL